MALPGDDPLEDTPRANGIHIEPRDADPLQTMVASGVGGILGSLVANAIGAGWLGRAVMSLGGSVAGYLLATNRVHFEKLPGQADRRRAGVAHGLERAPVGRSLDRQRRALIRSSRRAVGARVA